MHGGKTGAAWNPPNDCTEHVRCKPRGRQYIGKLEIRQNDPGQDSGAYVDHMIDHVPHALNNDNNVSHDSLAITSILNSLQISRSHHQELSKCSAHRGSYHVRDERWRLLNRLVRSHFAILINLYSENRA